MKTTNQLLLAILFLSVGIFTSCSENDDHDHDHDGEEMINEVVLTFTPTAGGTATTATWFDADADGAGNPTIEEITLTAGVDYRLTMALGNTLEGEDKTIEINEEADEHMFFFEFTSGIFADPAGDGNVDERDDPINYIDFDANTQPLGLTTDWTAGSATATAGEFRVALKHQPGLKTATSDFTVGGTDIDITFPLSIEASAE